MSNINFSGFWVKMHNEVMRLLHGIKPSIKEVLEDDNISVDTRMHIFKAINIVNARILYMYQWLIRLQNNHRFLEINKLAFITKQLGCNLDNTAIETKYLPKQISDILDRSRGLLARVKRLEGR